jgi:hypothetical protein
MRTAASPLLLLLLVSLTASAQERYFYLGRPFGSEALYNPLSLLLNGSYDIIQMENRSRDVLRLTYDRGARTVFHNLGSPFSVIRRYGTWKFIRREVFPFSASVGEAQWWPNYQLHLVGGGMTYVATREWYEHHGFAAPAAWSIATMAAYHLLNEVVEATEFSGDTVDPIADIYLFDVAGILLFSNESVCRFFSRELHLADWSLQPGIAVNDGSLQNNGQYFAVKWGLPFAEEYSLFYFFGLRGLVGLTRDIGNGEAVSVGVGLRATKLQTVEAATNTNTVELHWNIGLFYDRENSLLASLQWSDYADNALTVNVYPGILRWGEFSPGVWALSSKRQGFVAGISTTWFPGAAVTSR